ncbi:MAG: orotate phosphoribosyltransferase [Anaerovoracaceae bacterium]
MDQKKQKEEIAKGLLSIEAVFLRPSEPFTWASGIKSPVYCDNRLTLTAPDVRTIIENGFADLIREYYPDCELLMGTSTAGIAHAAIVGYIMDLPMGYVRGSNKTHGRQNRIEGKFTKGQKAVVIEDLISTAGSACETAEALREAGVDVLGIASIFTYGMKKSEERLAEAGLVNHSLCDLDTLVDTAVASNYITEDEKNKILKFRDDPSDESWMKEAE